MIATPPDRVYHERVALNVLEASVISRTRPAILLLLSIALTSLLLPFSAAAQKKEEPKAGMATGEPEYSDANPIPMPPDGTLLVGPYVVGPGPENELFVRWETQGRKDGALIFQGREEVPELALLQLVEILTAHLPGHMYEVELSHLEPCKEYRYRLTPFEANEFPHTLRAPPVPGMLCDDGLRIMVYGDSRTNHKIHVSLMPAMIKVKPHLLLSVGDVVFKARRVYEWHKFFQIEKDLLDQAPLAMAPGNHEGYLDLDFGAAMTRRYFGFGENPGPGHRSFDYGPVHIVMLDLNWGQALDGAGRKWLEDDLKGVPDGRYKFVVMHEPIYSFGQHPPRKLLKPLRGLFKELGVHAVFAGHSHLFEHFLVEGTHYLTLGGSGAPFHEPKTNLVPEEEKCLVKTDKIHHFLQIDINEEGATFQVVNSDDGTLVDEWTIKAHKVRPRPIEP